MAEKYIYIGPSLKGGRLKRHTVFIGGLPTYLADEFTALPQLERLFVPIADLDASLKKVATKGTALNKYYNLAKEV